MLKDFDRVMNRFDLLYKLRPDLFERAIDELKCRDTLRLLEQSIHPESHDDWEMYVLLLKRIVEQTNRYATDEKSMASFWERKK